MPGFAKNHAREKEIWLIYYKKHTSKPRIPYDDAVEEALCYGWIDSIIKRIDDERAAQRFSPRRPKSSLSETNKERVRRLIKAKKMTRFGLEKIRSHLDQKFVAGKDIITALQNDAITWKNFQTFPESYQRIRIGWIDASTSSPRQFFSSASVIFEDDREKQKGRHGALADGLGLHSAIDRAGRLDARRS